MTARRLKLLVTFVLCAFFASFTPTRVSREPSHLVTGGFVSSSAIVDVSKTRRVEAWYSASKRNADAEFLAAYREPEPVKTQSTQAAQTEESQHVGHFDPGSVQQLIVDIFGPDAPAALKVAKCESGYREDARNGQFVGPFQIGEMHRARAERLGFTWAQVATNAYANVTVAFDLFSEQGWRPWQCKP